MERTKLFVLLRCLDPKERRWVAGYFCQPYLAEKHATWRQLLNYLLDQTHQSQPKIDRKTIFIILFGIKTPYDDLRMRHIATNVLQQVETALAYYYAQRDDVLWLPLQTLRLYSRKQLAKHYNGAIENIKRHLSENEYRHADYFLQKYRYFNLQEQFNNNRTDPAKQIALVEASNSLDVFYIAAKLRMMAALGTLQQVHTTDRRVALADMILLAVAQNPDYRQYTAIAAYYYCINMQQSSGTDSDTWFEQLTELLLRPQLDLPFDEAQEIYFFGLNYCAVQINKGRDAYLQQIFALYQTGLPKQWLLDDGTTLSVFNYKNITTVALRLQQYDFVHRFLHENKALLPAAQRESAFTYNIANYHFYRREYDQVLPLLQQVSHDEIFYTLDARLLLLKTYYELDETEALLSLVDSTRQLLQRTKQLNRERQKTYRNFLKFVRKLSNLPPKATQKMIALRQQIAQTTHLADKKWLLSHL